MKSKMKIKMKIAGKLWGLSAILLFVLMLKVLMIMKPHYFWRCMTNAQLESPVIDDSFSLTNSDGTESVKITWPVVIRIGGYLLM